MSGLTFPYKNKFFSTKNGPINVDGHVYKITDLEKTYFSASYCHQGGRGPVLAIVICIDL